MPRPRRYSSAFSRAFGVGDYYYGFKPYTLDPNARGPGLPGWILDETVVGAVDMRPLPSQSQAAMSGPPQGYAFVASVTPVEIPVVRSRHMAEQAVNASMRSAWQAATGYMPQGEKLVDLLFDHLTNGADPSGDDGPKPLTPGVGGSLKLNMRGHSSLKKEKFNPQKHKRTADLLRRDGKDITAILDRKRFRTLASVSDNFNRTNGEIGSPWVEDGDIDVVDNTAQHVSSGNFGMAQAFYNSALASDNHFSQILAVNASDGIGDANMGATARRNNATTSAATFYLVQFVDGAFDNPTELWKIVSGGFTKIGNNSDSLGGNVTYRVECDGSTIMAYRNGNLRVSVTDVAITGNSLVGFVTYKGSGLTPTVDDFLGGDLVVPIGGPVFGGRVIGRGRIFGGSTLAC